MKEYQYISDFIQKYKVHIKLYDDYYFQYYTDKEIIFQTKNTHVEDKIILNGFNKWLRKKKLERVLYKNN